jgi:hypothetical protein
MKNGSSVLKLTNDSVTPSILFCVQTQTLLRDPLRRAGVVDGAVNRRIVSPHAAGAVVTMMITRSAQRRERPDMRLWLDLGAFVRRELN